MNHMSHCIGIASSRRRLFNCWLRQTRQPKRVSGPHSAPLRCSRLPWGATQCNHGLRFRGRLLEGAGTPGVHDWVPDFLPKRLFKVVLFQQFPNCSEPGTWGCSRPRTWEFMKNGVCQNVLLVAALA